MWECRDSPSADSAPFYDIADEELRSRIIQEWQDVMSTSRQAMATCAVCARMRKRVELHTVSPSSFDLKLLRNDDLPARVLPTTYAFADYDRALLHPAGMTELWDVGDLVLCSECRGDLVERGRLPKFALANWLYYGVEELPGDVRRAFKEATRVERMLVSRARASRISFRFCELKPANGNHSLPAAASQRCIKGNVLVMPQDVTHLQSALPPGSDALRDSICAVFVGSSKPTRETIARLSPVLVRKSRVELLVRFLVGANAHYSVGPEFGGFSADNLDSLFSAEDARREEAIPACIDVAFLEGTEELQSAESDYTGREEAVRRAEPGPDMLLETVGYTGTDGSPVTYTQMKMRALEHCLSGGRFVRSRSGNQYVPDFENPSLLAWLFPHLDPWGIGGFFEPLRRRPLTLEEQLSYLLQVHASPFEKDPDFAFVYYNILQKKRVCETINFRVKASQRDAVIRDLQSVDRTVLKRLIRIFKDNPTYHTEDPREKDVLRVLREVNMVGRDIPGTAAYRLSLRNEIRALIQFKGTPAFFVTLNPSDVHNPLVRLRAGEHIDLESIQDGVALSEWNRMVFVADHPCACAMAFHEVITAFVDVVLRYGRGRGLLG
ncbi:hypothetical protein C8Q76DRAFT_624749, partial [Earliella scabrosa]